MHMSISMYNIKTSFNPMCFVLRKVQPFILPLTSSCQIYGVLLWVTVLCLFCRRYAPTCDHVNSL